MICKAKHSDSYRLLERVLVICNTVKPSEMAGTCFWTMSMFVFLGRTIVSKGALGPPKAKVSAIVNVTFQKANIDQPRRGEPFAPELRVCSREAHPEDSA